MVISNSWAGGFIRLTRIIENTGGDYTIWVRASSIFSLMVSAAKIRKSENDPIENTIVTVLTCGYQGTSAEFWVREGPDVILAMIEAVILSNAMTATNE